MKTLKMNSVELTKYLNHMIQNGKILAEQGKIPVSVEIQGIPGLGKTALCSQVAAQNGMKCVKLSLAQFSDNGDMLGAPVRMQLMHKGEQSAWITVNTVAEYIQAGWSEVLDDEGKVRTQTEYCKPSWISSEDQPIMLVLDDWTRAQPDFMQSCMELVLSQTFSSWSLPKGSIVVLTSNPADGDMQVAELDAAQRTRFASVEMKWDKDAWAAWAETAGVDGRFINFILHESDEIFGKMLANNKELGQKVNARTLTMFANSITSITGDYASKENNAMVNICGQSTIGLEITNLFMAFIKNNLDKIPQPKDMYDMKEDVLMKALENVCTTSSGFRHDISTVLSTRLLNYSKLRIDNKDFKSAKDIDRLTKLLTNEKIFKEGQAFFVVRNLAGDQKYGKYFQGLFKDAKLSKALLA